MSRIDYFQYLHQNLAVLLNNDSIGFNKFQRIEIQKKPNKYIEITRGFKNYHFCVNIPYAGKVLNWEVIFDPEDLSELPDFDFNDYSFLSEPDINYIAEYIPSWDKWDLTNSRSMLNILNEFFVLYKKTQIEKLFKQNKYFQIKEQYEELLKTINITEDNIEVQIENKNDIESTIDDSICVNFLIFLPIDFSELPKYYQEDDEELLSPGEDFASLNIQMRKLDNIQSKATLTLSPRIEQILGKTKIPKMRKEGTLIEFASTVQNSIQEQIKIISEQHQTRNLFISAIVDSFSSSIVEYDASRFFKVNFIYEDVEDYACLITITLGARFPQDRPKIQMHSLYCQVGRNCNTNVAYAYNSEASIEHTMHSLRDSLRDEAIMFKNHEH